MGGEPVSFATQVATARSGRAAVAAIPDVLVQCPGAGLGDLVGLLDDLANAAAAVRAVVIMEAVRRGEISGALPTWIREHAPSLRQGDAQGLARVITEATKGGPVWSGGGVPCDPDSPIGLVTAALTGAPDPNAAAVTDGDALTDADPDADGAVVATKADDVDDAWDGAEVITTSVAPICPRVANAVLGEVRSLTPRLVPEAVPTVTRVLIDLGREWGPGQVRRLRGALLAQYGLPGELDDVQAKLAKAASLSSPEVECTGLTTYRLAMTPAQSATLEAVIGPLSAPAPNKDTKERDHRPAGQRRVEALTTVCERAAAAAASGKGGDGAAGTFAALHVAISLTDLQAATGLVPADRSGWSTLPTLDDTAGDPWGDATTASTAASTAASAAAPATPTAVVAEDQTGAHPPGLPGWVTGAGEILASRAGGVLLSPEQIRRIACHADLIPHVLGPQGEQVDLGHVVRLFTPAQRRQLVIRDRHCTYPGCDQPAAWTRAHHIWHWADGGPSDTDHAALLCEAHHTIVHTHRYWAVVRDTPDTQGRYVIWDLTPGSYDHALAQIRADHALDDPPQLTEDRIRHLLHVVTDPSDPADLAEAAWAEHQLRGHHDHDSWDDHDDADPGRAHEHDWFDWLNLDPDWYDQLDHNNPAGRHDEPNDQLTRAG